MTRALLLVAALGLGATPAAAKPFRCESAKTSVVASAAAAKLQCLARLAGTGSAEISPCLAALDGRLAAAFARADVRGPCNASGNAETVRSYLETMAAQLASRLQPAPGANRCAAAKLRAAGARLAGALRCGGRTTCLGRAVERFERAFTRAERRASCLTVGDASALGAAIGASVFDLTAIIATGALPPARAPSGFQAVIGTVEVALSWMNPDPASGHTEVKVVRRLNTPPTDALDPEATLVYSGPGNAATEPVAALLPDVPEAPRTYHYAVFGCQPAGPCESSGSRGTLTPTLAQALRGGGYVLYFRHATANVCADRLELGRASTTASPDWWKSCDSDCAVATARQLTLPAGETEALAIRDFFATRTIPFGRVLSSEFCRCFTSAELMDLGPPVERTPLLTFFVYDDVQDRCATSLALAGTAPAPGTNTALVTHIGFVCAPLDMLAPGEALVLKPDGAGAFMLVTRVTWDGWATLP